MLHDMVECDWILCVGCRCLMRVTRPWKVPALLGVFLRS